MRSFPKRNKKKKVQELQLTFLYYIFAVTHHAHTSALPLPPRRPPLVILGHIFSDCEILGALVLLTTLVVFLTSVGSFLISALMVRATIVAVHDPSTAREEENTPPIAVLTVHRPPDHHRPRCLLPAHRRRPASHPKSPVRPHLSQRPRSPVRPLEASQPSAPSLCGSHCSTMASSSIFLASPIPSKPAQRQPLSLPSTTSVPSSISAFPRSLRHLSPNSRPLMAVAAIQVEQQESVKPAAQPSSPPALPFRIGHGFDLHHLELLSPRLLSSLAPSIFPANSATPTVMSSPSHPSRIATGSPPPSRYLPTKLRKAPGSAQGRREKKSKKRGRKRKENK